MANGAGGRPTKYCSDVQKSADDYVDSFELYKEIKGKDGKTTMMVNSIPSISGLAKHLNLHRDTIYEWAKKHEKFTDTLEQLRQTQEIFLIHHGLTKGYDSGFAKFLAINVTTFKDKVETESKVDTNINLNYST